MSTDNAPTLVVARHGTQISTHGVLRNTYGLLSPTQRLGRAVGVRPDRLHGLHPGPDPRAAAGTAQRPPGGHDGHGRTATIFLALSAYAVVTRKDFSVMGGFLLAGSLFGFGISDE